MTIIYHILRFIMMIGNAKKVKIILLNIYKSETQQIHYKMIVRDYIFRILKRKNIKRGFLHFYHFWKREKKYRCIFS